MSGGLHKKFHALVGPLETLESYGPWKLIGIGMRLTLVPSSYTTSCPQNESITRTRNVIVLHQFAQGPVLDTVQSLPPRRSVDAVKLFYVQ